MKRDPSKHLSLLEQRRIEAGIAIPLIRAFEKEVGKERAHAVVREVVERLARERGEELGRRDEGTPLDVVRALIPSFSEDDALEIDVVEDRSERYGFDVRRCRFAELYRELGAEDLGALLSCSRDFSLTEGVSADLELERTRTIMEGASHCDFRFRLRAEEGSGKEGPGKEENPRPDGGDAETEPRSG